MNMPLASRLLARAIAVLVVTSPFAYAQTYPTRPVRLIVSVTPGSAPDIIARTLGERLASTLGQPFIVENRPGSNGNLAGEMVAKSPADGHTLLVCADSQVVINPHVYKKMSYDALVDLPPFVSVASNEFFLAANPAQPFRTFPEFIEHAKKANPPLPYGSGGNGGQHHLLMEMLKQRANIDLVHVPYKSGALATIATIAGEVAVEFAGSSAGPQIRSGKLRALAVAAPKRLADFPDVPAIAEFYPGFVNSIWLALCAPKGTPEAVIAKLRDGVNRLLATPEVKSMFNRAGALDPLVTSREELAAMVRADYEKYGKLVKSIGVKVD